MSVAVAATIAFGATGCEFLSPAHTQDIKQITDGVNVSTGKIDIRNALLIADTDEGARFVGTFVNTSAEDDYTVSIEVGGDTQTVVVPANSHVDLGQAAQPSEQATAGTELGDTTQGSNPAPSSEVVFDGADVTPGSLVKVYFSYSGAEGVSASVPVLTSALEEYSTLAPTPTPSSTPTDPGNSGTTSTGEADVPARSRATRRRTRPKATTAPTEPVARGATTGSNATHRRPGAGPETGTGPPSVAPRARVSPRCGSRVRGPSPGSRACSARARSSSGCA